jgi:uncharacterized membrane protein YkoI
MRLHRVAVPLAAILAMAACQEGAGPGGEVIRFNPPSLQFVRQLGYAAPVTRDQAMAIAAAAAGGAAVSATEEREGGELLFEVKVDTAAGRKEVEVRASDGGVVEIEPDDGD